jgi:hypothetical protein
MKPLLVILSDQERYAAFSELLLEEKLEKGWIEVEIDNRPGPIKIVPWKTPFPKDTVAQKIRYFIRAKSGERWPLAKVHQYKLPDGQIRGGPDPLTIRLNDVILTRREKHG